MIYRYIDFVVICTLYREETVPCPLL